MVSRNLWLCLALPASSYGLTEVKLKSGSNPSDTYIPHNISYIWHIYTTCTGHQTHTYNINQIYDTYTLHQTHIYHIYRIYDTNIQYIPLIWHTYHIDRISDTYIPHIPYTRHIYTIYTAYLTHIHHIYHTSDTCIWHIHIWHVCHVCTILNTFTTSLLLGDFKLFPTWQEKNPSNHFITHSLGKFYLKEELLSTIWNVRLYYIHVFESRKAPFIGDWQAKQLCFLPKSIQNKYNNVCQSK